MSNRETSQSNTRRSFFRKLALIGGAGAVAGASRVQARPAAEKAASAPAQPSGYRLTEHVAEYYRKARI